MIQSIVYRIIDSSVKIVHTAREKTPVVVVDAALSCCGVFVVVCLGK